MCHKTYCRFAERHTPNTNVLDLLSELDSGYAKTGYVSNDNVRFNTGEINGNTVKRIQSLS